MRNTLYILTLALVPTLVIGCCPCSKPGKCPSTSDSAVTATTEEPAIEEGAAETPATDTPVTEEATPAPAVETPVVETPTAEEATPAPTVETPVVETPATEEAAPAPAVETPVVETPATEEATPAVEPSSAMSTSEDRKAMAGTNDQWRPETSDDTAWIAKELASHHLKAPADNSGLLAEGGQKEGHTYKNVTKQDLVIWEQETKRLVVEGSRIFHSADLLGSTNGVSCDMCHPDARDTHPQTYPKYQVQLGRAAILRDMVNWCLENPCRGKPLSGDDPKMRAIEAYIQANNAGEVMQYNKH